MKRLPLCLLVWLLLFCFPALAADLFVATNGSDLNDGSREKPFATLQAALRKAREMRRLGDPSTKAGIRIILSGGTYMLGQTVFIRPEDAGTADSYTTIEGEKGEKVILSGGMRIDKWKKAPGNIPGLPMKAKGNIWVADVPLSAGRLSEFRQLWINDQKAVRAKSVNGDKMERILSWDKKEKTCWIPTPKNNLPTSLHGLEMFIHQWWAIAILRINKFQIAGDSTKLFFEEPESTIQSEHPWPAPWISKETGNSAFYLTNAIQFLDEPGEWWLDMADQKIYYWPRNSENMTTALAIAPVLETLIRVEGTDDQPVSFLNFKNISFQYSSWLRPSLYGHVPHQAGMYMTEAYKLKPAGTAGKKTLDNQAWVGRPAAAVSISFAKDILFDNCRFQHTASTGLDYAKGVQRSATWGCLFSDIGGSGILAGVFSEEAQEVHLPYNPKDERDICTRINVKNSLITNVANEDWSCVGIGFGYVSESEIAHNEISGASYTGISVGWGWTAAPNAMKNNLVIANKIHHYGKHNYDCAGIYTLSAQPGSSITLNWIDSIYKAPYAHLPSHWFYLYTDEGSSGITVKNNWTPSQKYLQNANGAGNNWEDNGPQVEPSIREDAGLQRAFQYMLKEQLPLNDQPINKERNEVIELIVSKDSTIDLYKLKNLLAQNKMDSTAIYQWQNHYVIFDKVQDAAVMQSRLRNNFPGVEVRLYPDMFYEFNRSYCGEKPTTGEWQHILLTADLVENKEMQQEYLDYHATQFEKWPEISKGFCNAGFQQLLIYKHGRQLVLVISIPKGESLDKLNPKTTENNPRVDEWNKIMAKYQQGITGTKKGETWVFLKKISEQ